MSLNGYKSMNKELKEALITLAQEQMINFNKTDINEIVTFISGFIIGSEYQENIHTKEMIKPDNLD